MRWRSEALAFDTRWLPLHSYIQATEEQQRLEAHLIPERPSLAQPLLTFFFPGVMPRACGHNPFYSLRARQEWRDLDALEKRSARL
ncbi:hypothetical protein [Paenibacillus tundrae]